MAKEVQKFPLRIYDPKTYKRLEKVAEANSRSINNLINLILEDHFRPVEKKIAKNLV